MALWKSYRIIQAVNEIDEGRFVLPVIQRSLVWTEIQMQELFDTVLKGNSFGGIMVIEEDQDFEPLFEYKKFTKDGSYIFSTNSGKLDNIHYFVIDGQQRLQAFYIGLKGSINGKILFFDLFSDNNSEYEFKFSANIETLPKHSKENIERFIPNHFWYPVSGLVERLRRNSNFQQIAREIVKNYDISNENQIQYINDNIASFQRGLIIDEPLGISIVSIDKEDGKREQERLRIVDLFIKLNNGGTKLSSFDLVASKLKGFDATMEGFLRETVDMYSDIGLSQENLIRLIFLLQDNSRKEMTQVENSDAKFATENRERISACLKALRNFLEYSKMFEYYKNSNVSFIPLLFIAYFVFHKNSLDNKQLEKYFDNYETGNVDYSKIKNWLYFSLLNGVFRARGAGWLVNTTGKRLILDVMKNSKNKVFPIDTLFSLYTNRLYSFTTNFSLDNLDQFEQSLVFYFMYDKTRTSRANDIDHIMPKNILESKNYEPHKINSIKNFQLLDYGTNRGKKNGKAFSEWVNNPEYVTDKKSYVILHLIPVKETIWSEDYFEDFSKERGNLIIEKLLKYTSL